MSSLPASQSFDFLGPGKDVLLSFRERLYKANGIDPPPRRSRSNEGRHPNSPLKVLITDNERHSSAFRAILHETVLHFDGGQANGSSAVSRLNVSFISWTDLQPWREQFKLLRDADILVSSIGSALFYSLLLPDGAATVNLGWNRPRLAWGGGEGTTGPGLPSYGEEFLGMSNRRTRTFYLPLDQVRRGPRVSDIATMLVQAETAVRTGFEIPLASPKENLGIFGRIMLDLQEQSDSSYRGLAGLPQIGGSQLAAAVLHEEQLCHGRATGQASPDDVVYEQFTVQEVTIPCHIDVQLLRKLKVAHGLKEALGVTEVCECVVCEGCGLGLT